jgi:hypothetical protein
VVEGGGKTVVGAPGVAADFFLKKQVVLAFLNKFVEK